MTARFQWSDEVQLLGVYLASAAARRRCEMHHWEMVQALFEQGVLTRNGRIRLARAFSETTLPTTVQGMLTSRIDRLRPKHKELLQTLAGIGREFPLSLAKRVTDCSDEELDQMLAHIQNSEFIYEQPASLSCDFWSFAFRIGLGRSLSFSLIASIRRRSDLSFVVAVNSFLSCFSLASGSPSSSASAGS